MLVEMLGLSVLFSYCSFVCNVNTFKQSKRTIGIHVEPQKNIGSKNIPYKEQLDENLNTTFGSLVLST